MTRRSKRKRKKTRRILSWSRLRWVLLAGVLLTAGFIAYVVYLDYSIRSQFEGKRWSIPARVYARPLELYPGKQISADQFENELIVLAYRKTKKPKRAGHYWRDGQHFYVITRDFIFWDSPEASTPIRLSIRDNYVVTMDHATNGEFLPLVRMDPATIGRIWPSHTEDRVLVQVDDIPPLLTQALILVEDRHFFSHKGISLRSILRAFLANLRAGGTVQGGSTLTQQLVKNFFLSNERTLWRKFNEAIMALLLEYHYEKQEILEAYINEIYLGQDGRRAIHGFGLASQFYFDKPLKNLDIQEVALLVAMVKGASYYSPRRYVKRAMDRRNLVIEILKEQGEISENEALSAKASGLGVTQRAKSGVTSYPAFMDLVRRQLQRDYREQDLNSEGLQIFTTFDPIVQTESEKALIKRVDQLGKSRDTEASKLQAASVVVSIESGEVLSMIGGRNPRFAGFNRALDAVRPIGSLVKPAVYLTALSRPEQYTLASLIDDSPLTLKLENGDEWMPENFDKQSHGLVPLYQALANSYNLSTARLGMDVGLPEIIKTFKRLGVEREVKPYPSMLLGAVALSPWEIAQVYHTLAAGGFRTPLRAITAVLTAKGEPLQRYPLSIQQVLDTSPVYLVNYAMRIAARNGTGRAVYNVLPQQWVIASKTGTSNDLRDSWFAGFAGDKLGVVWLGMDNNEPTGLTGASGALRVWADTFNNIDVALSLESVPQNIEMIDIDALTGLRGGFGCTENIELPFIIGSAPDDVSRCSGSGGTMKKGFNWFKELF